jgi:hypothetical protein
MFLIIVIPNLLFSFSFFVLLLVYKTALLAASSKN